MHHCGLHQKSKIQNTVQVQGLRARWLRLTRLSLSAATARLAVPGTGFFSEDLRIISPPLFSNDTFLRIMLGNPLGRIFYHEKGRTQCILFVVV